MLGLPDCLIGAALPMGAGTEFSGQFQRIEAHLERTYGIIFRFFSICAQMRMVIS